MTTTTRRSLVALGAVAAVCALALWLRQAALTGPAAGAAPAVREFMIFATYGRLTFWAPEADANAATEEIIGELQALHAIANDYDPNSELSHLNDQAAATPFACSDRLWDLLTAAREGYTLSEGAFDISVGPLMRLWGFHRKRQTYPSEAEIATARELVGLDKVAFDDARHTVAFTQPGMYLDLGGLVKGYGLDVARGIAERHGITCGMIDLGGNIYCFPKPPPGRSAYAIGIRNPLPGDTTGKPLTTAPMLDECIATSGNYEKCQVLDGHFVHHIVDPATGYPVPAMASVSVITPRGTISDIASTAVFVRGEPLARQLCQRYPGTRILCLSSPPEAPEQLQTLRIGWPENNPP